MPKLNLWEVSGKQTGFNPLPTGYNAANRTSLEVGDYIFTFRAKSASLASLTVADGAYTEFVKNIPLTADYQTYTVPFTLKKAVSMYLYDASSRGDIFVQDIQLVEKPLGRATINGIDDSLGNWEQGSFNTATGDPSGATGTRIRPIAFTEVEGGQKYICYHDAAYRFTYYEFDKDKKGSGWGVGIWLNSGTTFTASPTTKYVKMYFSKMSGTDLIPSEIGIIKPMLVLGTVPVPYEKKRGERMVLPQPGKNLFNKETVILDRYVMTSTGNMSAHASWNVSDRISVIPGENYTISGRNGGMGANPGNAFYTSGDAYISGTQSTSLVAPANAAYMRVTIPKEDMETFQVEKGPATPYEPYRVSTTRKAAKVPVGKNKFDGIMEEGYLSGADGSNIAAATLQRSANFTPAEPNTQYKLNFTASRVVYYNVNKAFIGTAVDTGAITTPSGTAYIRFHVAYASYPLGYNFQIEVGTVATAFEPFRLGARRATKTPKKNMFKGFINSVFAGSGFARTTIISDTEIFHDPTTFPSVFYTMIDVEPNTFYSVSFVSEFTYPNNGQIGIFNEDSSVQINAYSATGFKFNSGNRTKIRMYFRNGYAVEPVRFKNVQLELGDATPFESYKLISRPATKYPKKNMIQGEKEQDNSLFNQGTGSTSFNNVWKNGKLEVANGSSAVHGRGQIVKVEVGRTYTFSCLGELASDGGLPRVLLGTTSLGSEYTSNFYPLTNSKFTFTATSPDLHIKFLRNGQGNATAPARFWNIQLEPGDIQTPFESYKLQLRQARR